MNLIETRRQWMKSAFAERSREPSDQQKRLPFPDLQKPLPSDQGPMLDLPEPGPEVVRESDFYRVMEKRQSRRQFTEEALTLPELSFLLYSTAGVKEVSGDGYVTRRTVPSAGSRHPFETYLAVNRVDGLELGLYRYLPLSHQLLLLDQPEDLPGLLTRAAVGQRFVGGSACVFLWSCIPYRAEWRYKQHSHKNMLLDAGHICQNLYLAAEAIGAGTCAIGAYDQEAVDALLDLDGEDEYVVYLSPVGRIPS